MVRPVLASSAVLAALLLGACAPASSEGGAAGSDGPRFEKFKALAGDWVTTAKGDAPPGAKVNYRVSSAGSAVVETIFAGTPMEMTTVYFLDHGHLRLTHYCALKNQPSMAALPETSPNAVEFDLVSLGNGDAATDQHMHHAVFEFDASDHLVSRWTHWAGGKAGEVIAMDLVRAN